MAEDKVEDKKEEIWGVEQEEKLIQRLTIYGKTLDMGGVLWSEQQVEFLKLLCGEEAFRKAVELYNAPPKEESK